MLEAISMEHILVVGVVNLIFWLIWSCYLTILKVPMYHPLFLLLLYHFLGFVVRPFSIYFNDGSFLWSRIGIFPSAENIYTSGIVAILSLSLIICGYLSRTGATTIIQKVKPRTIVVERPWGFYLAVIVLTIVGYYATYKSFFGAGLDSVLAYSVETDGSGGQRLQGVSGYVTAMAEFIPIVAIILVMASKKKLLVFSFIGLFIAVRIYAGAQRLSFIVVVLAIFFLYLIAKGRRYPPLVVIVSGLIFAVIFDVVGNDRYVLRKLMANETTVGEIAASYVENRAGNLLTSDIVEFDAATATISVVNDYDEYSYGSQYLRIFIWPIPRQIWPGKPVYTSVVNLNDYGDFRFLTTSLYADVYMAFGFLSLVPMMFFLGRFMSVVYGWALSGEHVLKYMFFWVFIIYFKTIMRDGGVTVFYFWIFSMLAVFVLVMSGRLRIRERGLYE